MARKVIIDCDPGIDDAMALCIALFDVRLEVLAVTAVEGTIPAEQSGRNVQAIIDQFDPPRLPRVGTASSVDDAPALDGTLLNGADGLGNAGFPLSQLHHRHPSDKIIYDEVRAAPDEVTILCLGPLTNVALALKRDPELASLVSRIVIAGGSVSAGGDVTPAAETNMYCDPLSAREVFRSPTTKTLIPLDVTQKVAVAMDVIDELPDENTRAGRLLRQMLTFAFRAHHQVRGQESIFLHGVVSLLFLLQPELFETAEMAGDVETRGDLTKGATVFDRRIKRFWLPNMEVATDVEPAAARDCIVRGLAATGGNAAS
jgi:purine nucleosidase